MKSILLGLTVYGEHHVNMFLKYGLPSLMSPGNFDALRKERDVGLIVHTDKESAPLLRGLPFPMLDVTTENKYEQLGRHQNYDLKIAKESGSDYHCLMPDYVYSEKCFEGVMRAVNRGHKVISRLVVSTEMESILPEIDRPRSAIDLATLSLIHIHPGVKHWLATSRGYPNTHVIAWEGRDTLTLCSPHQSPVYIANEAIRLDGDNISLDAVLDKITAGEVYCPKPDDGIVIIEISPHDSRTANDERVDLAEFCRIMKADTKGSERQLYIFDQETIDPINREMLGDTYWNDVEIANQRSIINQAIRGD